MSTQRRRGGPLLTARHFAAERIAAAERAAPIKPDGRATTMLLGMAVEVLDYATACCEQQARLMMGRAAFDCLHALDRKPPEGFETRWNHLIDLLDGQRRAGEQGAAWDEAGKDFDTDIDDELTALAGEPRD